jgi:Chaperone of endosialidase
VSDANLNTAGGTGALSKVDETPGPVGGTANTAFGFDALFNHTTGHNNTAIGAKALYNNTTGHFNTASGLAALYNNTTGQANTASGEGAAYLNTTGERNTAYGRGALFSNTTGIRNTAIGYEALTPGLCTTCGPTGNKNIAIGFRAGSALTHGHNNIYLGSQGGDSSEFQTMRLGKAQTRTFIVGINTATVSDAAVMIDTATGQLGIATSSARYKQDIAPMGTRSEKMLDLRPVTFAYKDDSKGTTHYGLIAEEVAAVYPELVTRSATGEVQTVKYQELIPMLLNELQRQHQALQSQQKELAELRALVGQGRGKVVLGGMVE